MKWDVKKRTLFIFKWDVSRVTDMSLMFSEAKLFNSEISNWDVSSVTNMGAMFNSAKSFKAELSKWDVSSVTNMYHMFDGAASFNGDISKWDVSSVTNMNRMFAQATSFNADISKWDVSRVNIMRGMFVAAKSFKQTLCGASWVHSTASKSDMFEGSSGSISRTVCTLALTPVDTRQQVSRRPIPDRELIVRPPTTTSASTPDIKSVIGRMVTCSKCGTFKKSGRISCCAPGGSWYKNCGGSSTRNAYHRWSEGVKACLRKFAGNTMYIYTYKHSCPG